MEVVITAMKHELRPMTIRSWGIFTGDIDTREILLRWPNVPICSLLVLHSHAGLTIKMVSVSQRHDGHRLSFHFSPKQSWAWPKPLSFVSRLTQSYPIATS